jgi:cytochrome b pre-mRNA-processing protein 3
LSFLQRIFGRVDRRATVEPLYRAVVAAGRDPGWYRDGQVADTIDGRFDMLAAVTALVMLRLEDEGVAGRAPSVLLAELFIDDMDATLRQIGIGDYVVGKHVGKLMGALGGRLAAFRACRAGESDFEDAVSRNVFHESPPSEESLHWVSGRLERLGKALEAQRLDDLLAGRMPAL